MPTHFKLTERLAGYTVASAKAGETAPICYSELIGPEDANHLQRQLENLQGPLFSKVPGLPRPSFIDHILVVIRPNLECIAYVNELSVRAEVKAARALQAGSPVYVADISDITSVELGVDISNDCGVVLVRSSGWKRSLFFDFGPLLLEPKLRAYSLEQVFAQQALLLLGLLPQEKTEDFPTQLQRMEEGLARLKQMLSEGCEEEARYQDLLQQHPWMFGGAYREMYRHRAYDDRNVPDFTATRCYDYCHDIIEIKQPFLRLFRRDAGFTSAFNDAWNQAERYLSFANQQRSYLREEKELRFENPRCRLLLGYGLPEQELREIRKKESFSRAISVFTYDHLLETASHIVSLMRTAHDRIVPEI